jgi:CHAD domain-containing protein
MAKAKKINGIDCHGAAVDALGPVLITRLHEMCSVRERALKWSDPEGVHDMRVSSRRLRGALSDFAPYLGKRGLTEAVKQIKSMAHALGEVRDQDVAIMGLQKLAAEAPEQAKATLGQFIKAREVIRKKARTDLRNALGLTRLKQIESDFAKAIGVATSKSKIRTKPSKTGSEITYIEMARSIVNERLKELEKLSKGFYHPLNVKPLHKMRIAAKRLRYALELFEECLGPGSTFFARKVAGLQTSLGELNDCDIWLETFGHRLKVTGGEASKDRMAGSLWLLSHFVRLHSRHLRSSLARWEEWERIELGNQLRELLKGPISETTIPPIADAEIIPAASQPDELLHEEEPLPPQE